MQQSESLNELFAALAKAQGNNDIEEESRLCPTIARFFRKSFHKNNKKGQLSFFQLFIEKICFGSSECWFWMGALDTGGYGLMQSTISSKAHRISWTLFHGNIPKDKKVLHKCDNRNCVNPDHLFLGSQYDNVHDMIAKGRARKASQNGEENGFSKLKEEQILEIRNKYKNGNTSCKKLANEYSCSPMNICRIINRKLWSHV